MEYKHFSHPHNLKLQQLQTTKPSDPSPICSGCESAISESATAYMCSTCDFHLHEQCGNAVRRIHHPSHAALHHLTLVPYTTYSAGTFLCRACGCTGVAFMSLILSIVFFLFTTVLLLLCLLLSLVTWISLSAISVTWPELVAASSAVEKCGTRSDEGAAVSGESVPSQGSETEQTQQPAATAEQVEDPALRQQLELQKLQLELDIYEFCSRKHDGLFQSQFFSLKYLLWFCYVQFV
ncbi:hypothetical protein Bca4012_018153 [Brassica carinata]|uniref:Phorbol-ester/DAG-type domain-containing protein n=1 Tax=Brassica carinata TaxID=52824 RepID=A0A8X8BF85_BRACI|nr:hypothetical protein Bca52824_003438 [Brassica carinata]